jgi:hypothetical protein
MADETPHPDGLLEHPSVRYEKTDANFRWILGLIIAAAILGAIMFYVIWQFLAGYREYQAEIKKSPFPLDPRPSTALPPEPRLEQLDRARGIERSNVYEREKTKEEILAGVGPTDEKGFVHIPIDRAMKHLAGKLKARQKPPAGVGNRDNGLVGGGQPNSGRKLRGTPRWYGR